MLVLAVAETEHARGHACGCKEVGQLAGSGLGGAVRGDEGE